MQNQDIEMEVYGSGNFSFSAIVPEELSETEYTLVTIARDTSGSVLPFSNDLVEMVKAVIGSIQKSPKVDNIMVRTIDFSNNIAEIHGFMPVSFIDPTIYENISCGGMTCLRDATFSAINATIDYSETLSSQEFGVNGIVFIITDGDDTTSRKTNKEVHHLITELKQKEMLKGITTILIGINDSSLMNTLINFKDEVGIDQYVSVSDATPSKLAKLANFVSQSISSKSQSIGNNQSQVSQTLTI